MAHRLGSALPVLGSLLLWGCTAADDTGALDTADTADSGDPDPGDDTDSGDTDPADTGPVDTDDTQPVDTGACTPGVDESFTLYDVQGDVSGAWGCSTGVSYDQPYLRFEDTATGRLVAASEGSGIYRVQVPAGTYRVVLDGCGLIEQDQAGGTFLVDPALVVTGDMQRDLVLQGSNRDGLAKAGSAYLDSDWMWTMLHFYPVSGSQIPQRAIDRVSDGDDYFDSHEVPVWDGGFEAFLPDGTYWVAFGTRAMGPITIDATQVDIDFASVNTVVHLVTNGEETEGLVYIRPQGAPADLIRALSPDGTRSYPLVPGTYDVWVVESEQVSDSAVLAPQLMGIATLPGGLVVNQSGQATIALTLHEATLDVQCGGVPLNGDIKFRPHGVPGEVAQWSQLGVMRLWGEPETVGVVPGSSGLFIVQYAADCGSPAVEYTMPASPGTLAVDIALVDVTLDVRVDGVAVTDPYAATLYALDTGRYASTTDGVRPGDYLALVRRPDGAMLEKKVTITSAGTVPVNITTYSVPVAWATTGGNLPAWYDLATRFVPLADAGDVPEYTRLSTAGADATSIRLSAGAYAVSFTPDVDPWYYDAPLVGDGYCVEVGP